MRSYNATYSSQESLLAFIETLEIEKENAVLAQIFSGSRDKALLSEIIRTLKASIINCSIIGASTAGEIFNAQMLEGSITISVTIFQKTQLKIAYSKENDSRIIGEDIAERILAPNTKAIILFADGILCNGEAILKGLNKKITSKIVVSGGMAGDNFNFQHCFVICDEEIFEGGAVGVSLSGDSLEAHNSYSLSWRPIGAKMKVTKAEKNRVFEINDKPIIDIYREYLGEDVVENLPDSSIEFPLIFNRENVQVARSMVHADAVSIVFAGEIEEGREVRFGVANSSLFQKGKQKLYEANKNNPLEALFVYSCAARKAFLGKELEDELEPLAYLAPTSGFFTYGELYSGEKEYQMLNITTTVLGLSESKEVQALREEEKLKSKKRVSLSTTALIHLVEKNISILERESQEKQNTIAVLDQYQKAINASYIISQADLRGNITAANKKMCEISGYALDELLGKPHSILRHPDTPSRLFKEMWDAIRSKEIWKGEIQNRKKNGMSYYVDTTVFPLLDKDANITGYVSIRDDITEIKYQKERLEAILNAQESIVLLTSKRKDVMHVKELNKKFFDTFDYKDMQDFLSKHNCICDLFIEQAGYLQRETDGKSWLEILTKNPENGKLVAMQDKKGVQRVFSVKAKEIHFDTENFIVSTFTDVTELEQARVAALSAEKTKGAFLATMSHELRTPLNAVIGFSQIMMSRNDMPQESIKNYVEKINDSGKHLLSLVNNILDFSKIESGKMELKKESFFLERLFDEAFLLLEGEFGKKEMRLCKLDCSDVVLFADRQLIKQVLLNLLSNAVKFSPPKSLLTLRCEKTPSSRTVAVCDEGVGLSQEQIEGLFTSFSQVKEHQNSAIKGSGLGLAISKKILQLHDGDLEVQSVLGEGSCFKLSLPL